MIYLATFNADMGLIWQQINEAHSLFFEPKREAYLAAIAKAKRDVNSDNAVDSIINVLQVLRDDTTDSNRAYQLFKQLATNDYEHIEGYSGAKLRQNKQRQTLQVILRLSAFRQLGNVVINHSYQDKQSAHNLRLGFTQIGLQLQQYLSAINEYELSVLLSGIIATVGQAYESLADTLKPVAYLANPDTSLAVAWNLYQDPAQALDLIDRNKAVNGAFLPSCIEYLTNA